MTNNINNLRNKIYDRLDDSMLDILLNDNTLTRQVENFTETEIDVLKKYFEKFCIKMEVFDGLIRLSKEKFKSDVRIKDTIEALVNKIFKGDIAAYNLLSKSREELLKDKAGKNFDKDKEAFLKTGKVAVYHNSNLTDEEIYELNVELQYEGVALYRSNELVYKEKNCLKPNNFAENRGMIGIQFMEIPKVAYEFKLFHKLSENFVEYMEYFIISNDDYYFPKNALNAAELNEVNKAISQYNIQLVDSKKRPKYLKFKANFKKSERGDALTNFMLGIINKSL